jgi:hypothetical protein
MLLTYGKKIGNNVHIYESGTTYVGMVKRKVNRKFRDWNNKPLIFPNVQTALRFIIARNEIQRTCMITGERLIFN